MGSGVSRRCSGTHVHAGLPLRLCCFEQRVLQALILPLTPLYETAQPFGVTLPMTLIGGTGEEYVKGSWAVTAAE